MPINRLVAISKNQSIADLYTEKGDSLINIGKYKQALIFFEKAIQEYKNDNDIENFLWRFSALFYICGALGEEEKYLTYIKSIKSYSSYKEPYIWVYYRPKSLIAAKTGNYLKSIEYSNKAIEEFLKLESKNKIEIIEFYWNLALVSLKMGDFSNGLEYYHQIIQIVETSQGDVFHKMRALTQMGILESMMRNHQKAIYYYEQALKLKYAKSKMAIYVNAQKINILYHLSDDYRKLGDCKKALNYLQQLGDNKIMSHNLSSLIFKDFALAYECNNNLILAKSYFNQALKIEQNKHRTKHLNLGKIYKDYATFYLNQNKLDTALQLYQKGITSLVYEFDDTTNVFQNPKSLENVLGEQVLLELLTKKAQTLNQLYQQNNDTKALEASLETYKLASQLITLIRQGIQTEASKQFLAERVIEVYEGAIQTALTLSEIIGDDEYKKVALDFAEQNKAMVLLEALKDQEAKSLYLPDSLVDLETDYKTQIAYYEKSIYKEKNNKTEADSTKIKDWENTVFDLKRKFEKFQEQIETDYPDYFNLKYKFHVISLKEIQEKLSAKSALIEYFVGDSTVYSFVIAKNNLEIIESPRPKDFRETIENYRKSVGDFNFFLNSMDLAQQLYTESSDLLFDWLLKEQIAQLNPSIEELIIVPDDALSLVNFEALKGTDRQYLIERFALSYAYSATHLYDFSQDNQTQKSDIAYGGFAPIYEKTQMEESDFEESIAMRSFKTRGAFLDLPEARAAVQNIANQLKGEFWLADKATERNFKENAHKYDILHLAMHGVTDNQNPLYSKLIFTQENETGEDNYLNAYELYNMELQAKLAVLSACNTGYGELKRGEGVMSMARAFAYSGCPSLVMSLWSVPSDETANIMTSFHDELKKGQSKNQALRKAKQNYLKTAIPERQHPFFWAGFISIGDTSPVYQKAFSWTSLPVLSLLGLLLLLGIGFLIFRFKK